MIFSPGPTSEAHLLHSSATIPSRLYENYDARHHHTWEVSQSGDGLIQVVGPTSGDVPPTMQKPVDMRIERDVIEKLVNAYFTDIAPILPVITRTEFLSTPSPSPILLYSICLVAAARREVPQSVFDSIRSAVNAAIKEEDVLSTASIVNVQSLLILCMVGDCHSQFVPKALSALWIRLGTAIRMVRGNGLTSGPLKPADTCNHRLKTWAFIVQRLSSRMSKCGAGCGEHVSSVIDGNASTL
jgi:Fungal specific transcription factor domain